ncbi:hypothetical protein AB6D11_06235 [Vibrio splendidus]
MLINHKRWIAILLIIDVLYVCAEIAFNAALLNVAGGLVWDPSALEDIEVTGRLLSGVGLGLVLLTLWQGPVDNLKQPLLRLITCLLVAMPFMYFGQKWLIEDVIVKNANQEQRRTANQLAVTLDAIPYTIISERANLPYERAYRGRPEELTFMSMFPVLFAESSFFGKFADKAYTQMISETYTSRFELSAREGYEAYIKEFEAMDNRFVSYVSASESVNKEISKAKDEAVTLVNDKWPELVKLGREGEQARFDKAYQAVYDKMNRRYSEKYHKRIQNYFHEIATLCDPRKHPRCKPERQNKVKGVLNSRLGIIGKASFACANGRCPATRDEIIKKSIAIHGKTGSFKEKTGVTFIPSGKVSHPSKETLNYLVRTAMYDKRIGFVEFDGTKKDLIKQVLKAVEDKAGRDFASKASYPTLTHGLTKPVFLSIVLNRTVEEVSPMVTKESFKAYLKKVPQETLQSMINERQHHYKQLVESGSIESNSESQLEAERDMKRLIVPPFALAVSLFFSLFTLMRIPLRVLSLLKSSKTSKTTWGSQIMLGMNLTLIILVPLYALDNKLVAEESVFYYQKYGGVQPSSAVEWYLRTQPKLYPIGLAMLDMTGLNNITAPDP